MKVTRIGFKDVVTWALAGLLIAVIATRKTERTKRIVS